MAKTIEAIYEDGVFKPLEKVDLKNGEKVRLKISKGVARKVAGILKATDEEVKKAFEMVEHESIY
ncbi:MAG: antitoxin family protein [Archaeoglobales archaeon]|nr:antitoxin family protein [Archaeoglobales archaeon]